MGDSGQQPGTMALKLQFSEKRWQRVESVWAEWWAGELDRPLVVLECVEWADLLTPHYASTFLGNYPLDLPPGELLELFVPRLEATHWLGDAFPRFWPNFGPGIVAAFAGARVHPVPDTTWFSPKQTGAIEELRVTCEAQNAWWQRVYEVTLAAVQRWGRQLAVGLTDLGGNLDILASLRGTEQLLLDLYDAPEQVDRLVCEITENWLLCYDKLHAPIQAAGRGITCWGPCWSPGRGYMLQSDFAAMISSAMFRRFVLPDLAACSDVMDYAFYHLDGKGQIGHLDALLSLPRLRGIQWVPGDGQPPAEHWLPLLRRIRDGGKLCQATVTGEGALTIVRELGGKGFVLLIGELMTPQQGVEFLKELDRNLPAGSRPATAVM